MLTNVEFHRQIPPGHCENVLLGLLNVFALSILDSTPYTSAYRKITMFPQVTQKSHLLFVSHLPPQPREFMPMLKPLPRLRQIRKVRHILHFFGLASWLCGLRSTSNR